jgi:hypothetical protein
MEDDRDLHPAPGRDPLVQGPQRARGAQRGERGLHQHPAGLATAGLRDPALVGGCPTGLAHPRVQAKVGHELVRAAEAVDDGYVGAAGAVPVRRESAGGASHGLRRGYFSQKVMFLKCASASGPVVL